MEHRCSVFKGAVPGKAAGKCEASGTVKSAGNVFRAVCIGSEGEDAAADFIIALQNVCAGIWFGKAAVEGFGVQIKSLPFRYDPVKNLIYQVKIGIDGKRCGIFRQVTYNIIQMPVYVIVMEGTDIFQCAFKKFTDGGLVLRPS